MNLQPLIHAINGLAIELAAGVSLSIDCGLVISPVIHLVGETVRIGSPQFPQLGLDVSPLASRLYPILTAVSQGKPVQVGGFAVDFHGQLPRITARPQTGCVRLTWRTAPAIDVAWVPQIVDPALSFIDVFADRLRLVGTFGERSIPLEGLL